MITINQNIFSTHYNQLKISQLKIIQANRAPGISKRVHCFTHRYCAEIKVLV